MFERENMIMDAVEYCVHMHNCDGCPYEYEDSCVEIGYLLIFIDKLFKEYRVAVNETKVETFTTIQTAFAMHFGTYTDTDTVKIADVVKLLEQIKEDTLK